MRRSTFAEKSDQPFAVRFILPLAKDRSSWAAVTPAFLPDLSVVCTGEGY
jgi:hypothetical protein